MLNFDMLDDDLLVSAARLWDLDRALAKIFAIVDPANEHDLGGEAGVWFSKPIEYQAPADNGMTEAPANDAWTYLDEKQRLQHLRNFLDYTRKTMAPVIRKGDAVVIEGGLYGEYSLEAIATRDCYDLEDLIYVKDEEGKCSVRGDLCTRICVNGIELLSGPH
jgi:hypothetical protein